MSPTKLQLHALKVVESLAEIYNVLYGNPDFMSDAAIGELEKVVLRLGMHYQMLQVKNMELGRTRWKSVPTVHYVAGHLVAQAEFINPRVVQGYMSESLVGVICDIYKMSQSWPFKHRVQQVALMKYRTGLRFLWDC